METRARLLTSVRTNSNQCILAGANPITGHVLVPLASVTSPYPPEIHILSGADGSDLGQRNRQ